MYNIKRMSFIASKLDKLQLASLGILNVFKKPSRLISAMVIAAIFSIILTAFANGTFYWSLLFSQLGLIAKLHIIDKIMVEFLINLKTFSGFLTLLISILQGFCIILLIYNYRHQPKINLNQIGSSTLSTILAAIGLGCPTCGTSLILPIIGVFSSSSLMLVGLFNNILIILSFVISCYALWKLGYIAYANWTNELYLTKKGKNNEKGKN